VRVTGPTGSWVVKPVKDVAMGRTHANLVGQVQEALRGGVMSAEARERAAAELHARIQRLRDRDARFARIEVSPYITAWRPAARTA
jgi:hypothetical protein